MKTFDEATKRIALEIVSLIVMKQHDYGQGNILAFGEFGVLVRASDKLERLKNLLKKDLEPENESIIDTWRDLAGYAIIALMLREDTFSLPLENKDEINGRGLAI